MGRHAVVDSVEQFHLRLVVVYKVAVSQMPSKKGLSTMPLSAPRRAEV